MTDYSVEIKDQLSSDEIKEIFRIGTSSFPRKMRYSPETFLKILKNPRGIRVLLKNKTKKTAGYISSLPHNEIVGEYSKHDPNLREDSSALYIESIAAVIPSKQYLWVYSELFKRLLIEARRQGWKKVTMHVRCNLSLIMEERYGISKKYTVQNWFKFSEDFDYIEYLIPEEGDVLKR